MRLELSLHGGFLFFEGGSLFFVLLLSLCLKPFDYLLKVGNKSALLLSEGTNLKLFLLTKLLDLRS